MDYRELTVAREFLARLEPGADWREEIGALATSADVEVGWVTGYGALEDAELWYFDQDEGVHRAVDYDEPLTVATCVGTVTPGADGASETATGDHAGDDAPGDVAGTADDEAHATGSAPERTDPADGSRPGEFPAVEAGDGPRVHTHAVLARPSGQAVGGHLHRGTVYTGRVRVTELEGVDGDLAGQWS